MASSFVAGLLVTAAIFLPRLNDPIPEPYFGFDESETETSSAPAGPRGGPRLAVLPRGAEADRRVAAATHAPATSQPGHVVHPASDLRPRGSAR